MKPKENNLEKNISRLVKLAGDADKPSGAFVDSVMEDALDELKTPGAGAKREKKDKSAKSKSRKIFAYAAAVIFVSGVVVALTLPSLNRVRRHARKMAWSDEIIDGDSGPRTEKRFKLEAEKSKVAERSKKGRIVVVEPSDKSSIALYNEASKDLESDIRYVEVKKKYGVVALGTRKSGAEGSSIRFGKPERGSGGYPMAHGGSTPPNGEDVDGMFFKNYGVNPFVDTEDDHLSTFATDVDTGSYTVVRRYLHDGHLPPVPLCRTAGRRLCGLCRSCTLEVRDRSQEQLPASARAEGKAGERGKPEAGDSDLCNRCFGVDETGKPAWTGQAKPSDADREVERRRPDRDCSLRQPRQESDGPSRTL
jgi:hypothetical protein